MIKNLKSLLTVIIFFSSVFTIQAQKNNFRAGKKYPADSLKSWTTSIMEGISEKHPGFYRYTSKEKFNFLIDSTKQTIHDSLTELEYYRKLKPLFAQIGCLHTGISLSRQYQDYLEHSKTLIPIEVFVDPKTDKVLITKNYSSDENIPIGGEVVSINGMPVSQVKRTLMNSIASDGYNVTEKYQLLNYRFPFWYQSVIDAPAEFKLRVRSKGVDQDYEVKGVCKEVFPSLETLEKNYRKPLEFEITDQIGLLKIHSFAQTALKEGDQDFNKFIKNVFQTLKKQNIKNLVIDLRNNVGGTDNNAARLASYFFDKPFRYWDKIEVTEAVANEIKGVNKIFYKKPEKINGSYQWKKSWLTKEFDYYETQKPAADNFTGQTYIITNGLCMSSCADLVAVLAFNKKAIIVGEETGGGYQGNTSGMITDAPVQTGLIVSVPLQKYTNAVDLTKNFGHGTPPNHAIFPALDDWINKRDVETPYVFELIKKNK